MFTRCLIVGWFFMTALPVWLFAAESVPGRDDNVLELVKRAAWFSDPDPAHYEVLTKIYKADPHLVSDILLLFDIQKPAFYNANLLGMIRTLERKRVCPEALPKVRNLLEETANDLSMRRFHCGAFEYLSEYGDFSDCERLKKFELSANITVRTISGREQKKLEARLAAVKTNTPPSSVSPQNMTNVTVNSTVPASLDRSPNSIPSTTVEKTDGPSAGFKWVRMVTFMVAAVSGFLFVFFRRWKKR